MSEQTDAIHDVMRNTGRLLLTLGLKTGAANRLFDKLQTKFLGTTYYWAPFTKLDMHTGVY